MARAPTALVAEDEPLLRESLIRQLAQAWPELNIVAEARNGREAIRLFDELDPDVCFLDVQMPGVSGVEVAQHVGGRAHLVFVTAFDHYAVQAFAQGALDYLVKPVEAERLAASVARLKERLAAAQPATNTEQLLRELTAQLAALKGRDASPLKWVRAQVGRAVRLIAVEDIDYLKSDSKYTRIAWHGDHGAPAEALVRMPLKEFVAQLEPTQFVQVHRSAVVNLRAIDRVVRHDNETAEVHLKGRDEVLPVSRNFLNLFRQM